MHYQIYYSVNTRMASWKYAVAVAVPILQEVKE